MNDFFLALVLILANIGALCANIAENCNGKDVEKLRKRVKKLEGK